MAFRGKNPVISNILINSNTLEQVSQFSYLEWDISFKFDKIIKREVNRFQTICGKIVRTLGRKTLKGTH